MAVFVEVPQLHNKNGVDVRSLETIIYTPLEEYLPTYTACIYCTSFFSIKMEVISTL